MKMAIIGTGKTGSHLLELMKPEEIVGPFNSQNPPSVEKLKPAQAIICFVPGAVFLDIFPVLVESKIPVITGATGFEWTDTMVQTLKDKKLSWLNASNFSMGVQLLKPLIKALRRLAPDYLEDASFSMTEWHHTHKKDAPSGTALTLKQWLDLPIDIKSVREGDIVGIHQITLNTAFETIELTHKAKDRKLFAAGAINAAKKFAKANTSPGLHNIDTFLDQETE